MVSWSLYSNPPFYILTPDADKIIEYWKDDYSICISKLEPTGLECHARTINELDLQEIVLTALNELLGDKSKYQKQLQQNIASVIRASAAIATDGIDEKLMELQQELVKRPTTKKPTMRLPTRFSRSEKSASKLQWTQYSVM